MIIQEITEPLSLKQQPVATSPSQPNLNVTPQEMSKRGKSQTQDKNKEEDLMNKERIVIHNPKTQSEKPFDLENEIGKLKIAIPL